MLKVFTWYYLKFLIFYRWGLKIDPQNYQFQPMLFLDINKTLVSYTFYCFRPLIILIIQSGLNKSVRQSLQPKLTHKIEIFCNILSNLLLTIFLLSTERLLQVSKIPIIDFRFIDLRFNYKLIHITIHVSLFDSTLYLLISIVKLTKTPTSQNSYHFNFKKNCLYIDYRYRKRIQTNNLN